MFISNVNDTGDKLFGGANNIADKFITGVNDTTVTSAINLCHKFSVIGSVVDTGDKFITGVVDTAEQLSPVTKTPAINLSPVSMTPVKNYC
jgi:hypothetical protein